MKHGWFLVVLCLPILALPLLACVPLGPPKLVAKSEPVDLETILAANNHEEERQE